MEKLKNEYLSEISNLYEELRKDTYRIAKSASLNKVNCHSRLLTLLS